MAQQDESENTYVMDNESGAEMARLLEQDKIATDAMGGLLSELSEDALTKIADVLDIGCGPGGWVLELAQTYPTMDVTGIDLSRNMIDYALTHRKVRGLQNADFRLMNALKPLDFPSESFDLVNIRSAVAYVPPQNWPDLLSECKRILRPDGIMRITDGEWGFSTGAAFETLLSFFSLALWKSGRSFSATGRHLGITPVLPRLLKQAGFVHIERNAYVVDYSFDSPAYAASYRDFKLQFKLAQPFLVKAQVATQEDLDVLYEQVIHEMSLDDFCGILYLLTVSGKKL